MDPAFWPREDLCSLIKTLVSQAPCGPFVFHLPNYPSPTMKLLYTLLTLLLFPALAFSQAEIVATVVDTTGTTFPGANAVLLRAQDSLLTSFGTTDDKGVFRMQNVAPGKYLLRVTFLGYERPDQELTITSDDQYLGLGDLKMYPAGFFLNGVEVTADRIPIRMKGDTMLYDADAFAVGENAVVEDLLRRLPGMSVDAAGNITWRGRPISEVMINGKPFFAGNTTLLTQNLDAKAITNVEVYDQKTDTEEITGIDDGTENMTVNLEMKEEFKAKIFGELYGGVGSTERYQAGGKIFRISDATQLGILGTINNINKVGFSGDEISGFNGSSGRGKSFSFGGGGDGNLPFDNGGATGENRSFATGINLGQSVGKNGQLTANYALFDRNQIQTATTLEVFNQQNNRRIVETLETNATNNYSHRIGFDYRHRLDTTSRLRVEGSLSLIGGDNNSEANTMITDGGVTDDFNVQELNENERPGGDIQLSYNRGVTRRRGRYGSPAKGRTFGVEANAGYQRNNTDQNLETEGLDGGLSIPGALVNGTQIQNRRTNTTDFGLEANFAEPLGKDWRLRVSAGANYDNDEGDYRFRLGEETAVNLLNRTWFTGEAQASFVKNFKKGGDFSFGTSYEANTLELSGDEMRNENFNFINPFIRLGKRTKKGYLRVSLNSNSRAPSITQLQTIAQPGVSGRVTIGNPLLDPARNFSFRSFMWYNDQFRAISANFNISATYTDNAFGNEVTFEQGQQIFKAINIGHAWQGNANVGSTIGMNFISGEMRLSARVNGSRGDGLVDGVIRENTSVSYTLGANITSELNADSYLTVGYDRNNFTNSFSGDRSVTTTQITNNFLLQFELEVSPRWRFESRFLYSIFEATEFGEEQTIPDLRLSLELRPFKKKRHFVRLSASDLFNQNTIINRSVNQFSTIETTANGLGRYFLATFYYKI